MKISTLIKELSIINQSPDKLTETTQLKAVAEQLGQSIDQIYQDMHKPNLGHTSSFRPGK